MVEVEGQSLTVDDTANMTEKAEVRLKGLGTAPGIAIGPVYVYARDDLTIERRAITESELVEEAKRFERAVSKSERELQKVAQLAREVLGEESAGIFEAQALMLRDDAVYDAVITMLKRDRVNVEYAIKAVMSSHSQLLLASKSEYFRQRAEDILDLQDRIIRNLLRGKILSDIDVNSIVVAENLSAADIMLFSRQGILGTATDFGGETSHVSIMARALGLPAVVSMHGITESIQTGDIMILNGLDGHVIINPSPSTLASYKLRRERYKRFLQEQKQLVPLPAETIDGHNVSLVANLEFQDELAMLAEYGAKGIGLFRTEILFLMHRKIQISENEQFNIYRRIAEEVAPHHTTFRLLDLGGDKMLPLGHREHNPFLGWRGIRILLDRSELLIPQLQALLRASIFGPMRLMLPMVTNIGEVLHFKEIFEETKANLRQRNIAFNEKIPLGIMVEVPAVALSADIFAREVDFFSIGTNDLTQYTMAVDRGNDLVSDRFQEMHPAVLQLIKRTVDAAHDEGIPVSLCGEMAAKPEATPVLVGLGLDELSASPTYLPEVKRVIRAMTYPEAQELADQALVAKDAVEVHNILKEWLLAHGCGVFQYLDEETNAAIPE